MARIAKREVLLVLQKHELAVIKMDSAERCGITRLENEGFRGVGHIRGRNGR